MSRDWKTGKTYEELFGKEKAKEIKEKQSQKVKERHSKGLMKNAYIKMAESNRNRKVSEETREKMSNWQVGKKLSEETKQKQSVAHQLRKKRLGYINSPQTRKNLSDSIMGHPVSEETKQKIKEARAKQIFPIKDSKIELKIQDYCTMLKLEYFTHKYMNIKHGYQCDILIPVQEGITQPTVIECDGNIFHFNPKYFKKEDKVFKTGLNAEEKWKIDEARTKELIEKGYRVIRIWEDEIKLMTLEDFKKKISNLL